MDIQAIKVAEGNKLTHVMIGALFSGKDGEEVQAGPRQINALVDRGLVAPETHTLTNRGRVLIRALEGETLTEDEEDLVYPASVGGGRKYFVSWPEFGDPEIRPYEESEDEETPLSFVEAKEQLIEYAINRRNHYRDMIKSVRSLRAKNLGSNDEPDDENELPGSVEPEFSDA